LNQFKFTESANSRKASLDISLPDRPSDEIAIDKPIPFYVLVVPSGMDIHSKDPKHQWTQQEIDNLHVGFAKLELIPRGTGKLVVSAPQLYYAIHADGAVDMYVDLTNEGSRRLDN